MSKPLLITLIVGAVVVVAGITFVATRDTSPNYEFVVAERTQLVQEVSATGIVTPAASVDLAFENTGRVTSILASVGDTVELGDTLVRLSQSEVRAQLAEKEAAVTATQAQLEQRLASLASEEAQLADLQQGARPQELEAKEAELAKAEQDLANYYTDVTDTLDDIYATADDAVRTRTSGIFDTSKAPLYQLSFASCDNAAEVSAEWQRFVIDEDLNVWAAEIAAIDENDRTALTDALTSGQEHLDGVHDFLALTNNLLTASCTINNTSLDTYRTNVQVARSNVTTDAATASNLQQSISSQKLTVDKIRSERDLLAAGSTDEAIAAQAARVQQAEAEVSAQRAAIEQAEAAVATTQAQLAKTELRSPIAGTITKQDAEVGEIITAQTTVVSVITTADFEVEVNIPEVDILKIEQGDATRVALDAYGPDTFFPAAITTIDPAETIIEGVPTYQVTFQFTEQDARIRSGMTADVDITTDTRSDVIAIPARAIVRNNGDQFVRIVQPDGSFEEVAVVTGLRGSDGRIEITDGVTEGDRVITFIPE